MDDKTIVLQDGKQNELISVIIPTYNRVELLGRSIRSVLSQTYTNLELLIIDDCSDDGTGDFVKGLSDKRIRYHRNEKNLGLSGAKNRGISLAKGNLVAFQDDDDEWLPHKLARLMEVWNREGDEKTGMIYHEMQEQGSDSFIPSRDIPLEWKSKDIFEHMLLYPMIGATASLIRKSCLEELGGFNEALGSIEDYEFYLRMARKHKILFVGEPLMIIYDTPGSVNKRFKSKIDTELYVLDTMYDSLCRYGILQKKVNLIRQQAENYDCEDYFYRQALKLCEKFKEKGESIRECIGNAAKEPSRTGNGDRAEYYQNAAEQIRRVTESLARLKENLKKNPAVLTNNKTAVVEALLDIIGNLGDYSDLALHPVPKKQRMDELSKKLTEGQKSNEIIKNVLDDTLKEAGQLFSQIGKAKCLCTVCGKEVRFLPKSPYKQVMREFYGYKGENIDFLFEGEEDRCPVCGAPENIRFLLGFLEDIQPEGNEKLKIYCMEVPGTGDAGLKEWIRKYAAARDYMEYISTEDAEERCSDLDVIICADILECVEDDSEIAERITKLLSENGVCIVMTPALVQDSYADFSTGVSGSVPEERASDISGNETDGMKDFVRFGLEGVRRLYTGQAIGEKFEGAGFQVSALDESWFGRDYYEQCGFGEKAKMFMLTRESQNEI